ncbi:MAG TPA: hypothetical protein VN026_17160 [Bacteroidia bacterium]|jgi:hypothetical protein|nr:hypothetical protein [Bacteroidia bacterium]
MKKQSLLHTQKKETKIKDVWTKDGRDYICSLGRLKKAIVIRYFTPMFPSEIGSYYAIAHASFLPFTDKEHATKFNDPIECIEFAESIVLEWMQSLFVNDEKVAKNELSDNKKELI